MTINTHSRWINRLSIQQRLMLLICSLLLSAIAIYGFANYYSLRKTTLIIGKDRLTSLTKQVSTLLSQNTLPVLNQGNATAVQNTTIQFLKSGGTRFKPETLEALNKLHRDSTWVSVELINKDFVPVLRSENSTRTVKVDLQDVIALAKVNPYSSKVGKIYNLNGAMYYPVVSTVSDQRQIVGYIVSWIYLKGDPKAVSQFSRLVGTDATLYIANSDLSLWTDMIKPVSDAPFKIGSLGEIVAYKNKAGEKMIACAQPINHTDWVVAIEFSEHNVLNGMNTFVNWIILIGIILTAIGIVATWAVSRSITRPLNLLTNEAKAISQGNYSSPKLIDVSRHDELGDLANAFNTMTAEIFKMIHELDDKVNERTSQLERANKELEAFSYSVSHDLRTPLRAVSGYSIILKEDYDEKLDSEGKRIIGNIIANARMMGQLIDDLLAFSRLGKKELISSTIDMQLLATTAVNELLQHENKDYEVKIGELPPIEGDIGMIKQALMNLLSNAIKYSSKKDHPLIEIGAADEKIKTIYYVKDNGVGFDMAYAGKLFGVFQRLHSQEEFEGTGVGLALVKRIIDKHKGEVWGEGIEGSGATFYFSLPKISNYERQS